MNLSLSNLFPTSDPFQQQQQQQQDQKQLATVELASFERIFCFLRHEWIWNFFFESNEDEIDMLMYAAKSEIPSTIEVTIMSQDCGDLLANSFRVYEHMNSLFLSSFSTGNLSVGFMINDLKESAMGYACKPRYISKYALDTSRSEFFIMANDSESGLSEVQFINKYTKSHIQATFGLFDTKKLLSALNESRSNNFSKLDDKFYNGLIYHYQTTERCQCSSCGKTDCFCVVEFRKQRHGYDPEVEMHNLVQFCGRNHGQATLKLTSKGIPILSANYPSYSLFNATSDYAVKNDLLNWALTDSISRKATLMGVSRGFARSFGTGIVVKRSRVPDREVITAADNFVRACIITEIEEDKANDEQDMILNDKNNILEDDDAMRELNRLWEDGLNTTSDDIFMQTTSSANDNNQSPTSSITNQEILKSIQTSSNNSTTGEESSQSECIKVMTIQPKIYTNEEDSYSERARLAAAQVVAQDAENRQRRVEERKRRNRIAAAKSNERRRQAMDKLKKDIEQVSLKESELREQEGRLRRQNALLREKLRTD